MLFYHSLAFGLSCFGLLPLASAQGTLPADLVGTWASKSKKTVTGPTFYDPLNDKLIEPERTGISYSFTYDGHFEEAYYRAISNPTNPSCPSAIMQWQHGSFVKNADGSLTLSPIEIDGRQLLSEPCDSSHSIYTRYNQSETFERYETLTDPYHNVLRLNLYEFDGTPMQPLYQIYDPPQMLPTTTLHNIATATATAKGKRGLDGGDVVPLNWKSKYGNSPHMVYRINTDRLWWVGLAFTGIGGVLYFGPRRLGIRI